MLFLFLKSEKKKCSYFCYLIDVMSIFFSSVSIRAVNKNKNINTNIRF